MKDGALTVNPIEESATDTYFAMLGVGGKLTIGTPAKDVRADQHNEMTVIVYDSEGNDTTVIEEQRNAEYTVTGNEYFIVCYMINH